MLQHAARLEAFGRAKRLRVLEGHLVRRQRTRRLQRLTSLRRRHEMASSFNLRALR